MALLELRGVHKGYGDAGKRTDVLRSINLDIERG
jgi:hypothetical protein